MQAGQERLPTRAWALAGALLFLGLFWAFLRSSPADLYLDDSGETVTVAARLGLGHPPGYPLHTLIAHLACLVPWASAIWRVNVLGALFGALGAMLVGLWCLRRSEEAGLSALRAPVARFILAALPAALLAFGPVYWHNALGAKGSIYQLNNLLSVVLLGLLLWGPLTAARARAFALFFGLALAHHYMSQAPLIPAYAWLLWRGKALRLQLQQAWLAVPGILLYAYLPLRWAQHPDLAWGSFADWHDFWFYFFRLQYAAGELTRSAGTSLAQALHALKLCAIEGSYVGLLAAMAGAWLSRREQRAQALGLGWLAALASVTFYLNLKPERLDLMQPYLFPAYLCQLGLAIEAMVALLPRWGRFASAVPALLLSAVAALGAWRWPQLSLADYYFASDNARGVLQALPRNALLLAQGDAVIFPLWHRQRVLNERPDVAVIGLAVLPMDWVREDLGRHHPDLRHPGVRGPIGAESVPQLTAAYLALNPQRPFYAAFNKLDPPLPGWRLQSEGPVWRVLPASTPGAGAAGRAMAYQRLSALSLRGHTQRPLDERSLSLVVGDHAISYNSLGVEAEEEHALPEALADYRQAERIHPESPDYPFNQGNILYALGQKEAALGAFRRSTVVDPAYLNGWYNWGVTAYQLGRRDEAKAAFQKALALAPERQDLRQLVQQLGP
jgi:tetratricopeptide (TPR) repeat protein